MQEFFLSEENGVSSIGQHCPVCLLKVTYLLTPWSRVLLEKLNGFQLVKKFPAFNGTWRFITAITTARHLSRSTNATPNNRSLSSILNISASHILARAWLINIKTHIFQHVWQLKFTYDRNTIFYLVLKMEAWYSCFLASWYNIWKWPTRCNCVG